MASFREIILKTVGDGDDARKDLDKTAAELKAFDQFKAEAEATVDTDQLKRGIKEAKADLATLSKVEATPEVDLATAKADAKVKAFEARMAVLAAKSYDVELNVDTDRGEANARGFLGFVTNLWQSVGSVFQQGAQSAGSSVVGLSGTVSSEGPQIGALASVAGEVAAAVGVVMVAAIGAGITALVALASSAIFAAGALGAVAIAAASLLLPIAALAGGAIARFKEQADQAGTAANKLKTAFTQFGDVFKKALGPGADAVFRGLARGLNSLKPLIKGLTPEFTAFGKIAGQAIEGLLREFSKPAWRQFFQQLIKAAGSALPLLVQAFIGFARVLRNIASASMPFLIQGLKALARFMTDLGNSTSNAGKLRGVIGGLVDHLRAWFGLAKALGRIFVSIFIASAGPGKSLVKVLTDGANAIADWIQSAKGQEQIKQFFADVMPLVKQVAIFFGELAVVAIQLFQFLAPAMTSFFSVLNLILKPVIFLLGLFNKIPASIRSWLIPFASIIASVKLVLAIFTSFGPQITAVWNAIKSGGVAAFGWVKNAASDVFTWIKNAITNVVGFIANLVTKAPQVKAWLWLLDAVKNVAPQVLAFVKNLASQVGQIASKAAGNAWHWILDAAKNIAGAVRGAISSLVSWIKDRINDAITIIRGIVDAIKNIAGKAAEAAASLADAIARPINAIIAGINAIQVHLHIGDRHVGPVHIPGIDADIDPFPGTIPQLATGIRDFMGGLAVVGEQGPELVNLPSGSDVHSATETAAMRGDTSITVIAPEGELPDAGTTAALIDQKLRARGVW